ncbi:uncharacterized protein BJ212DRAFT_1377382, partial [Suillus subaureus]
MRGLTRRNRGCPCQSRPPQSKYTTLVSTASAHPHFRDYLPSFGLPPMKRLQLTVVHSHQATIQTIDSFHGEFFDGSSWEEAYYREYERSFAREVEAYRCLEHLQGSTIPRLYGL